MHSLRPERYDFEVSFDLVDAGQVVYHPNYYILLERARFEFCKRSGLDLFHHFKEGYAFVVGEIQARYMAPLLFCESYYIISKVRKATRKSLRVEQQIFHKEKLVYSAEMFLIHAKIPEMKAASMPDRMYEVFKADELKHAEPPALETYPPAFT
jgi:YbgC/YbaW family acyl-CoA thioester hydrolase